MSASWAVVGDVIASRGHPDRVALGERLAAVWAEVAGRVEGGLGPATTVGDEFQALYEDRTALLVATFWIRVALVGHAEVRMGIGHGEVTVDAGRFPFGQDGPAWWAAREALERVEASERGRGRLRRRTAVEGADDDLLDGYLVLRDEALGRIDAADGVILRGLADGRPQAEVAAGLGVNESSVSRRITDHGLRALLAAEGLGA